MTTKLEQIHILFSAAESIAIFVMLYAIVYDSLIIYTLYLLILIKLGILHAVHASKANKQNHTT